MPICDEYDINMCVHPDDPPYPVFGLPRIIGRAEDIQWMLDAVPNKHNGLTFCAGSFSAGEHNDCVAMAKQFADRKIGRASCRERVQISVVAVSLKKKKKRKQN